MTTDALRHARQAWAYAHIELDKHLTQFIPVALAADSEGGEQLAHMLTEEQTRQIGELYGRTVGLWAAYRFALRHIDDPEE